VIVMPRTTPEIKISAVRALGGEVLLHGDSYDEAQAHALQLCRNRAGFSFIHTTIRM
jgi:threonine dehydratase